MYLIIHESRKQNRKLPDQRKVYSLHLGAGVTMGLKTDLYNRNLPLHEHNIICNMFLQPYKTYCKMQTEV